MPSIGDKLGRYVLLERLASGGMGEVFVAAKPGPVGFGPLVALKVLREELAGDGQFVDMLIDEANIARHFDHPNLVSVLDLGVDAGHYYIAMEFVQGVTAERLIETLVDRGERLDVCLALHVGAELCRGLRAVHGCRNEHGEPLGIIHRDVTPANILLSSSGEVKLTDFGIARAAGRLHQTQAGVLKGKFGYMAPEMVRYESLDARADLFCAGVVIYLLASGRHPVANAPVMEAIQLYEQKRIPPPSTFNPALSPEFDAVLMRALEPQPDLRWQTAEEMGEQLQELLLAHPGLREAGRDPADLLGRCIAEVAPEAAREPVDAEALARHLEAHRDGRTAVPAHDTDENDPRRELSGPATRPSTPIADGKLAEPELPGGGGGSGAGDEDRTVAAFEWSPPERTVADDSRTVVGVEGEPDAGEDATWLPGPAGPQTEGQNWDDPGATLLDDGASPAFPATVPVPAIASMNGAGPSTSAPVLAPPALFAPSEGAPLPVLDWSDEAAARRAVETRNAVTPPPPVRTPEPMVAPSPPPPVSASASGEYRSEPAHRGWVRILGAFLVVGGIGVALGWLWFGTAVFWPRLQIQTDPAGARVIFDGTPHERPTPTTIVMAPGHRHSVELEVDGHHPEQRQLTDAVARGRTYRLDVLFRRFAPRLFVTPEAERVLVNGEVVGEGKELALEHLPERGPVEVRVEKKGFEPYTVRFQSARQIPPELDVALRKADN